MSEGLRIELTILLDLAEVEVLRRWAESVESDFHWANPGEHRPSATELGLARRITKLLAPPEEPLDV